MKIETKYNSNSVKILDDNGVNITSKLSVIEINVRMAAQEMVTAKLNCYLTETSLRVAREHAQVFFHEYELSNEQIDEILKVLVKDK